jgi:hypothetical protein
VGRNTSDNRTHSPFIRPPWRGDCRSLPRRGFRGPQTLMGKSKNTHGEGHFVDILCQDFRSEREGVRENPDAHGKGRDDDATCLHEHSLPIEAEGGCTAAARDRTRGARGTHICTKRMTLRSIRSARGQGRGGDSRPGPGEGCMHLEGDVAVSGAIACFGTGLHGQSRRNSEVVAPAPCASGGERPGTQGDWRRGVVWSWRSEGAWRV